MKTLDEHIRQADIYREHKNKKRSDSEEILFASAKKYLSDHLNGRNKIPIATWKTEYKNCVGEKDRLYQSYYYLKDETRAAELVQKAVEYVVFKGHQNISPDIMR